MTLDGHQRLDYVWAKSNRGTESAPLSAYRPLRYHLIDAACVAEDLWDRCIPLGRRNFFTERAGVGNERDLRTIAVVAAGLHDIGKCNPRFQAKHTRAPRDIFGPANQSVECESEPNHAYASGCTAVHANHDLGTMFADILRGHHGRYQRIRTDEDLPHHFDSKEPAWLEARHALAREIFDLFGHPNFSKRLPNEVAIWLSGFVVACDWIASTSSVYRPEHDYDNPSPVLDARSYLPRTRATAAKILKDMGWLARPGDVKTCGFAETFGLPPGHQRNIGQEAVLAAVGDAKTPSITLIEYPTGYGKSEAALEISGRIAQAQQSPGMFFALPTRASSDPMYTRATTWISNIHKDQGAVQIQLLHGTAAISKTLERMTVQHFDDGYTRDEGGWTVGGEDGINNDCCEADGPMIASWFGRTKRGMLSPYAVGTVDQLLIAGLAAKHTPLRIFGLGCKSTIIVDEVHAYDRYMTDILKVVIGWLGQMGVSVVLLSATVTERLGKELIEAWLGHSVETAPWAAYPRIAHARAGGDVKSTHVDLGASAQRTINIDAWPSLQTIEGRERVFAEIPRFRKNGGRYVIMCNTVKSAQDLFKRLRESQVFAQDELELYHARLIEKSRQEIHKRIERQCGKNRPRSGLLVVVSTQLLEASIDVDFDEAWSEIAPLEALLQRAGRMHRHHENTGRRPVGASEPTLHICGTERTSAFHPYNDYDVLRTIEVLRNRERISVPEDISNLIERVYEPRDETDEALATARKLLDENLKQRVEGADLVTIKPPRPKEPYDTLYDIFSRANGPDDPETCTRWNAAGVRIVVMSPEMGDEPYDVDNLIANSLVVSSYPYLDDLARNLEGTLDEIKISGPKSCAHGAKLLWSANDSRQRDTAYQYQYDPILGLLASRA